MYHYENIKPLINTYCFFKLSPRKIRSDDLGLEVLLIDYNNIEAFIPITEINRRKFNITTFFKPDTIYPALVYSIENLNISYLKIKEEKREKLLKSFEIQTKICTMISKLRKEFNNFNIINPIIIDSVNTNYMELSKLYENILLNPEQITSNDDIIKYIIEHRKLIKPVYEQHFTLTVIESNGLEILKNILNQINKNNEYHVKIISSPLYCIEFNDLLLTTKINNKLEETVKNISCLFELKELLTIKELHVEF